MTNSGGLFVYNIIVLYSIYRILSHARAQNELFPSFCAAHTMWCIYINTLFFMITCVGTKVTREVCLTNFNSAKCIYE